MPRRPWPSMRPGVIGCDRRMRLPSTTPHPASFNAGSICSALVSASFMGGLQFSSKSLVQHRLFQRVERGELPLVEAREALGFFLNRLNALHNLRLRFDRLRNWDRDRVQSFLGQLRLCSASNVFIQLDAVQVELDE